MKTIPTPDNFDEDEVKVFVSDAEILSHPLTETEGGFRKINYFSATYRGYGAVISYDAEDDIYHGKVRKETTLMTFGGETLEEAVEDFKTAVDEYIEDMKAD